MEREGAKGKKLNYINAVEAKCPFFIRHTSMDIMCESPVPGSSLTLHFFKKSDKKIQYTIFCCDKYENCEMYQACENNYEDDEP